MKLTTSLPSNAEAKNGGAIPPLPHVFMAYCLIKHRDKFAFTRVIIYTFIVPQLNSVSMKFEDLLL
jgi:hypothetical protein